MQILWRLGFLSIYENVLYAFVCLPWTRVAGVSNHLIWVLGPEPRSSARAANALEHWAIPPAPEFCPFSSLSHQQFWHHDQYTTSGPVWSINQRGLQISESRDWLIRGKRAQPQPLFEMTKKVVMEMSLFESNLLGRLGFRGRSGRPGASSPC